MADMGLKAVVAVTTDYHVGRVILTAAKHLPKTMVYVVGVPFERFPFDIAGKMIGEIRRILDYADLGDIADPISLPYLLPRV